MTLLGFPPIAGVDARADFPSCIVSVSDTGLPLMAMVGRSVEARLVSVAVVTCGDAMALALAGRHVEMGNKGSYQEVVPFGARLQEIREMVLFAETESPCGRR